jgi:hypothetical protein
MPGTERRRLRGQRKARTLPGFGSSSDSTVAARSEPPIPCSCSRCTAPGPWASTCLAPSGSGSPRPGPARRSETRFPRTFPPAKAIAQVRPLCRCRAWRQDFVNARQRRLVLRLSLDDFRSHGLLPSVRSFGHRSHRTVCGVREAQGNRSGWLCQRFRASSCLPLFISRRSIVALPTRVRPSRWNPSSGQRKWRLHRWRRG